MLVLDDPNLYDAAIPAIIYACATYGSRGTRWAAFTSSLVGAAVAGVYVARDMFLSATRGSLTDLQDAVRLFAVYGALTAVTLLLAWTLGLLVSTAQRSRRNRRRRTRPASRSPPSRSAPASRATCTTSSRTPSPW